MNENSNNTLNYILGFLIVILLGIFTYFYFYYSFITKDDLNNKYTKNYQITFDSLPYFIKSLYIKKEICDENINLVKKQNNNTQDYVNQINSLKSYEHSYKEEKQLLKEKITNLNNKINKLNDEIKNKIKNAKIKAKEIAQAKIKNRSIQNTKSKISNKTKKQNKLSYKTLMCIDMKNEDSLITDNCINKINNFAKKRKNSSHFEVMGLLNINEYKNNKDLKLALSKKRVSSGIWELRKALDFKNKVFPVNYDITSKKEFRGVIIRAYYKK